MFCQTTRAASSCIITVKLSFQNRILIQPCINMLPYSNFAHHLFIKVFSSISRAQSKSHGTSSCAVFLLCSNLARTQTLSFRMGTAVKEVCWLHFGLLRLARSFLIFLSNLCSLRRMLLKWHFIFFRGAYQQTPAIVLSYK